MNKFLKCIISLMILSSSTVLFANGVPVDKNGDTIPVPTGNVASFSIPGVFASDDNEYTWDYSGTLKNANQLFSFQATVAQIERSATTALDLNIFSFAFQTANHWFYSNSSYGGSSEVAQSVAQSLNLGNSSAGLNHFSVNDSLILNSSTQWHISAISAKPEAPLYKGLVGQPGREYQLTGTGRTFLWRYNKKTGIKTVAPYNYTFSVQVLDTRGVTMEGMGGGYVGAALINNTNTQAQNVEAEVAQPRLRVLNWAVSFSAINSVQKGYQSQYSFSGNNGMLWNDFGPVDKSHPPEFVNNDALTSLIQSELPTNIASQFATHPQNLNSSSLYNGNWIPVSFTKGKYAGVSIAFSVFWNKTEEYAANQSTSNVAWSSFGWANFFGGIIPNEIDSANSMLETLYPENPIPANPGTTETPPYTVTLNQFTPSKYNLAFPWAQNITITIKANTPLRYALAAYADQLAKSTTADDPSKNIVIHIDAISPITQNTMFSKTITQYYEGAAVPTMNGKVVGYSWIEHMV